MCPVAYEHPGSEGHAGYLTDSMPLFERGTSILNQNVLSSVHYLSNTDGCGKGFEIIDMRFYLEHFTSMPTDMRVDVFFDGTSFGSVDCIPLSDGVAAPYMRCDLLGVHIFVTDDEDVKLSMWAFNLPEVTEGTTFGFDLRWKDLGTGVDNMYLGVTTNRW